MEAKTKKLLIGGAILLFGAGATYWAIRKYGKPAAKSEDEQKKEEEKAKQDAKDKGQTYTAPKANTGFPIEFGTHNTNTKPLQEALIKRFLQTISGAPSDYLGKNTLAALKNIGYDAPVSKEVFDRVLDGKYPASTQQSTPTGGSSADFGKPKKGKVVYARVNGMPVYTNKSGNFYNYSKKDDMLGTISDVITEMAGTKDERVYVIYGKDQNDKKYKINAAGTYTLS